MGTIPQETADLVTFTKDIFNKASVFVQFFEVSSFLQSLLTNRFWKNFEFFILFMITLNKFLLVGL